MRLFVLAVKLQGLMRNVMKKARVRTKKTRKVLTTQKTHHVLLARLKRESALLLKEMIVAIQRDGVCSVKYWITVLTFCFSN